ncbi:hypothetical protein PUNSTDRAFT_120283, partial [Punctularia strigosozonata HHB-11173 SS5]|uniref:uncharacterized protein n=1 Tax=Punctularia strigosozonata (strain HHB-11173) TaxID=741275 RepID=UPI0004416B9A
MVVSVTVIDCILLLRTWAIWECSRLIMAGLSALGTLCILALAGATLFADLTVIPDEESRIVRPCDTILPRVNVLYSIWISILVYDTTVMTLTMIRIIPEVKSMVSKTPLAVRVLRDGVQFFLALSLIAVGNIVVLNAAPPQLSTMLFTFHRIMVSTLGSRIILNLR